MSKALVTLPERRCIGCDEVISVDATKCGKCHSAQGNRCHICAEPMLKGATRCNACGTYQNRLRRHFPTITTISTLIGGFVIVCSAVIPAILYVSDYHSHTAFKVAAVNGRFLYVKVWNSGRKPSAIVGYQLKFGHLPIETVSLDLSDDDQQEGRNVIVSGSPVKIALTIGKLELREPGHPKHVYSRQNIKELLKDQLLTLELQVEESHNSPVPGFFRRSPKRFESRVDTFPAASIVEFLMNRMECELPCS